jgi:hypothetical protein
VKTAVYREVLLAGPLTGRISVTSTTCSVLCLRLSLENSHPASMQIYYIDYFYNIFATHWAFLFLMCEDKIFMGALFYIE